MMEFPDGSRTSIAYDVIIAGERRLSATDRSRLLTIGVELATICSRNYDNEIIISVIIVNYHSVLDL